jgi:uncharacterized damage-inducible protein DinB
MRDWAPRNADGAEKIEAHMTVKDLETLFGYGHWANRKLFAVMSTLTPEQFAQPLSGNHGSIRNTMVHMLSAEWGWLDRCGGPKRGAALDPGNFPTVASLVDAWNRLESQERAFLSTLRDGDLSRIIEFAIGGSEKRSMPMGELLHHGANHGVHHRGQVSLLLRLLGCDPENFDMLFYYAEKQRLRTSSC